MNDRHALDALRILFVTLLWDANGSLLPWPPAGHVAASVLTVDAGASLQQLHTQHCKSGV